LTTGFIISGGTQGINSILKFRLRSVGERFGVTLHRRQLRRGVGLLSLFRVTQEFQDRVDALSPSADDEPRRELVPRPDTWRTERLENMQPRSKRQGQADGKRQKAQRNLFVVFPNGLRNDR